MSVKRYELDKGEGYHPIPSMEEHADGDWVHHSDFAALAAENAGLRDSLLKLSNEIHGMLGMAEHEIRAAIGHTNVAVIQLRLKEASEALSRKAAP